jgi:hypothetical protein
VTSGLDFYGSKIIFLSFIRTPPTDYDKCSYHLLKPVREVKVIFKKSASLLLINRCSLRPEILLRELSCVVVRLGEFHLLMSFMGCIGAIMARSCLKALFMTIYTENTPGQGAEWSCLFTSCTSTHFD